MPALFHLALGCVSVISVPYALHNYNPLAIHSFLKQSLGPTRWKLLGSGPRESQTIVVQTWLDFPFFPQRKVLLRPWYTLSSIYSGSFYFREMFSRALVLSNPPMEKELMESNILTAGSHCSFGGFWNIVAACGTSYLVSGECYEELSSFFALDTHDCCLWEAQHFLPFCKTRRATHFWPLGKTRRPTNHSSPTSWPPMCFKPLKQPCGSLGNPTHLSLLTDDSHFSKVIRCAPNNGQLCVRESETITIALWVHCAYFSSMIIS